MYDVDQVMDKNSDILKAFILIIQFEQWWSTTPLMKICCQGEIKYDEVDDCVRRSDDQRCHYKQTVIDFL